MARTSDGPYVFHTERSERFTPPSLHKFIQRVGTRAGVDDCYPHRLRHSTAITMLSNGLGSLMPQRVLGHTSPSMTLRYVALNTTDL